MKNKRFLWWALSVVMLLFWFPAHPAYAAGEIIVDGVSYAYTGEGLSQAIQAAPQDGVILVSGEVKINGDITLSSGGKNLTVMRNAGYTGNLIHVALGKALTLSDITVDGNKGVVGTASPMIKVEGALVLQSGAALQNNMTGGLGGAVLVLSGGTVTMSNGAVIRQNEAGNGGGASIALGGAFTMNGGIFEGNTTTGIGGGGAIVYGEFFMDGGLVQNNTAPGNGGGINIQPGGKLTITGGSVEHNTSGGLGGGVSNLGTLTVTGGRIASNMGNPGHDFASGNANQYLKGNTVIGSWQGNTTIHMTGGFGAEAVLGVEGAGDGTGMVIFPPAAGYKLTAWDLFAFRAVSADGSATPNPSLWLSWAGDPAAPQFYFVDSTVAPRQLEYTLRSNEPKTVHFTGSRALVSVAAGGVTAGPGDYTVTGNDIVFSAGFLEKLPAGSHELWFTFASDAGNASTYRHIATFLTVKANTPGLVQVTPVSASLRVGETAQLTALVLPADAWNKEGVWSSSDPEIATVDPSGLVTGHKRGSAEIRFTTNVGALSGSAEIAVVQTTPKTGDGAPPEWFFALAASAALFAALHVKRKKV